MATPVIEDDLTPQQREHSKLYERTDGKEKIRDVLMKRPGGVSVSYHLPGLAFLPKRSATSVKELAEKADAVVMASFVSKSSQITTERYLCFHRLRATY